VRGAPFWCRRADTLEAGDVIFVRLQIFCIGEATRKRCGKSELMVSEKLDAFTRADFDIRTGASNAIRENFRTAIQANQILDERAAQLALGDFAKGIRNPGNLSTKSESFRHPALLRAGDCPEMSVCSEDVKPTISCNYNQIRGHAQGWN
jgi:hypothetical protein